MKISGRYLKKLRDLRNFNSLNLTEVAFSKFERESLDQLTKRILHVTNILVRLHVIQGSLIFQGHITVLGYRLGIKSVLTTFDVFTCKVAQNL